MQNSKLAIFNNPIIWGLTEQVYYADTLPLSSTPSIAYQKQKIAQSLPAKAGGFRPGSGK
jgi:hypothetical protein